VKTHLSILCLLPLVACADPAKPSTDGMVLIAAGKFTMGSERQESRANERPEHLVGMDAFWIDVKNVTNEQFAAFVRSTNYKTTAEQPIDWEQIKKSLPPGTPKPDERMLQPGSLVFSPPDGPVDLQHMENWWKWVHGASWQHPAGPDSDIKGLEQHPVVQISWHDALAYATWAGKRLPSEAEWEYAARGGREGNRYAWGDQLTVDGKSMANTWTGDFPYRNDVSDGFKGTSPVGSFPANGYGLHDMGGNVWNWCSDWYRPDIHARHKLEPSCHNPSGPKSSYNPVNPYQTEERVTKGGSFLCHVSYCESYRPSARRGLPPDTGMSHVGFRCAMSAGAPTSKP